MDEIIDKALDCQEKIAWGWINSSEQFIEFLSSALNLENKLTKSITDQICTRVDFILAFIAKEIRSQNEKNSIIQIKSQCNTLEKLSVGGGNISTISLAIMNEFALEQYDKMPERFR